MIGSAVFSKLSSLDLSPSLQSDDGTYRIFPNYAPMIDKGYPQIVFDCIDYKPDYTMDGSDGLPTVTVKVGAIGETYDDADQLGRSIAAALDGTYNTQWGNTAIAGCFLEEVSEDHFVDTDLETILYYTKELEFSVIFRL